MGEMKDKIFCAATELFGTRSYADVSMRDIAKKVGIQASSIYNHYSSKEEILNEIICYYMYRTERFHKETIEKMSREGYKPKLKDLNYSYNQQEEQFMLWVTRIIYAEQFTNPLAADALIGRLSRKLYEGHRRFFRILYQQGIVQEEKNIEVYAEMYGRMGYSFQMVWLHPQGDITMAITLWEMSKLLLKLILSSEHAEDQYEELVK